MTGIPQTTISFVARGLRELPSVYYQTVWKEYRRLSYNNLRKLGVSSFEATRLRYRDPEEIYFHQNRMSKLVNLMTRGRVGSIIAKEGEFISEKEFWNVFDMNIDTIKDSLRKSDKTIDEWYDYLFGMFTSAM